MMFSALICSAAITLGLMVLCVAVWRLGTALSAYLAYFTVRPEAVAAPPEVRPVSVATTAEEEPLTEPKSFFGVPMAASLETDKHRAWRDGEEADGDA